MHHRLFPEYAITKNVILLRQTALGNMQWHLEYAVDGEWETVDQAVEGNDYWQAYDDVETGDFDLIFNIHNRGTNEYRLVR